jgi:hypothetical protein
VSGWLDPVLRALDEAPSPVLFFFRDDDVGVADEKLYRLLDLFAMYRVPVDLAVIPDALEARLAERLLARRLGSPDLLGLHQHGLRHANHETNGRKCEFGASRTAAQQLADIAAGRNRLVSLLADKLDPFFTPPWNRCSQATADALARLGFAALSRDAGAAPLDLHGLAEVAVNADWMLAGTADAPKLAERIAGSVAAGARVGVMLHHAVMSEEQLQALEHLLDILARHPRGRCCLMRSIVERSQSVVGTPVGPYRALSGGV